MVSVDALKGGDSIRAGSTTFQVDIEGQTTDVLKSPLQRTVSGGFTETPTRPATVGVRETLPSTASSSGQESPDDITLLARREQAGPSIDAVRIQFKLENEEKQVWLQSGQSPSFFDTFL